MSKEITADFTALMRQAPATAETYLYEAVNCIDGKFGTGYSKQHPDLVGSFINCCAVDLLASTIGKKMEDISEVIDNIAKNMLLE